MPYFSEFPKIVYNINNVNSEFKTEELVTNIFYRLRFRDFVKNNTVDYYYYTINDTDTPEGLAFQYYDDAMAYWIIFFANDIIDPIYGWPLNNRDFRNYIIEKHGSIATAKTTVHHYNKIIYSTDSNTGLRTTRKVQVDLDDPRANTIPTIPYDDYNSLAEAYFPNVSGNFGDGSAVTLEYGKEEVSLYDWENDQNEAKRNIKMIRKDYYPAILEQMQDEQRSYYRSLRGF